MTRDERGRFKRVEPKGMPVADERHPTNMDGLRLPDYDDLEGDERTPPLTLRDYVWMGIVLALVGIFVALAVVAIQ
jgi:hypothetical protein